MSKLIELIRAYLPKLRSQKGREDAYLNQAVDINDLERRMREIDNRTNGCCTGSLTTAMGVH